MAHADIADPVAALVLGARPPLELLIVNGETVVERDEVVTVDERHAAAAAVRAASTLREKPWAACRQPGGTACSAEFRHSRSNSVFAMLEVRLRPRRTAGW